MSLPLLISISYVSLKLGSQTQYTSEMFPSYFYVLSADRNCSTLNNLRGGSVLLAITKTSVA